MEPGSLYFKEISELVWEKESAFSIATFFYKSGQPLHIMLSNSINFARNLPTSMRYRSLNEFQ